MTRDEQELSELAAALPRYQLARPDRLRAQIVARARVEGPARTHAPGSQLRSQLPFLAAAAVAAIAAALLAVVVFAPSSRSAGEAPALEYTRPRFTNTLRLGDGRLRARAHEPRWIEASNVRLELSDCELALEAKDGMLTGITVIEGTATLHFAHDALLILRTGDHWTREKPRESPVVKTKAATVEIIRPIMRPSAPEERAEDLFEHAFQALRSGDHRAAAEGFARLQALDDPLAEDAAYWRAVALAKSGDAGSARAAFSEFLARYSTSTRAGEVAVMLGWLELDAGDRAKAEEHFRAGAGDPKPDVRASAAEGLESARTDQGAKK